MKILHAEKILDTSHGRFLLRPYRNEDEDNVIDLWETAFKQKMDRRIWRWKFHDNPFGRQMMLCLTESEKPVAMYAGIPFLANWNGQAVRMTQLIDNMSHPAYRQVLSGRKGLFIQTADFFFEIYGNKHASVYHYGFPGIKHYKLGKLFLQYNKLNEESCYMELNITKMKKPFLFPFGHVKSISKFDEPFDLLWENAHTEYPLAVKRNSIFLNWRFTNNPVNNYSSYAHFNKKGVLLSYAVFMQKQNLAIMVDVFAKRDSKTLKRLVYYAAKALSSKGVEKIQVWLSNNHFITHGLKSYGFVSLPEPLGIIPGGRSFVSDLKHDFASQHIFYTMADGDLF
jgi:hypothetical protein